MNGPKRIYEEDFDSLVWKTESGSDSVSAGWVETGDGFALSEGEDKAIRFGGVAGNSFIHPVTLFTASGTIVLSFWVKAWANGKTAMGGEEIRLNAESQDEENPATVLRLRMDQATGKFGIVAADGELHHRGAGQEFVPPGSHDN